MEIISTTTSDGFELTGLYSRAPTPLATLVHVHGYGGDFYSHPFVKMMHHALPRQGFSFVSFGMRTTSYIGEQYTDDGVQYVGSALIDQHASFTDIEAVVREVSVSGPLVLQGHSFGTNLVRNFALTHQEIARVIFLGPSDSVKLQAAYTAHVGQANASFDAGGNDLRWDLLGIVAGGRRYPIPITGRVFEQLVAGAVFGAWSPGGEPLSIPSLVVQGKNDEISLFGNTGSPLGLAELLPNMSRVTLPDARHTFRGHESTLCSTIIRWLRETT